MPDWFVSLTGRALTYFLTHLFINRLVNFGYRRILNVLLNVFLHRLIYKWPTTNSLFVRNCGFLSWDRIYFQGCHWSIHFKNYIPALSLEKIMYGYPRREKKSGLRTKIKSFHSGYSDLVVGIKGYPF